MHAISFDTLKFAQKPRDKVKFPPEQAEQLAVAFADPFGELQSYADLATKDDLQKLELSLKNAISDTRVELLKWMFGAIGLQTLAILGTLFGLLHNIGKL